MRLQALDLHPNPAIIKVCATAAFGARSQTIAVQWLIATNSRHAKRRCSGLLQKGWVE